MSPESLIIGHPYYFYGADGKYTKVLFHAMRLSEERQTMYAFRKSRFDEVQLNAMQVQQLIFKDVPTQ